MRKWEICISQNKVKKSDDFCLIDFNQRETAENAIRLLNKSKQYFKRNHLTEYYIRKREKLNEKKPNVKRSS